MTIDLVETRRIGLGSAPDWLVVANTVVEPTLVVVILARDEALLIDRTIKGLQRILPSWGEVHVVADHCKDATASLARRAGAVVHIRSDRELPGKGPALSWWLEKTHRQANARDIVVVLDADSQVAPDFFLRMRSHLDQGAVAVQARLEPRLCSSSPVTRLAAFSEIAEHRVNDTLRSRLGWPVRLRGTGMAFRRGVLGQLAGSLHTLVEDAELSILLAAEGFPITFAPETYVVDPKPADESGAVRQRARWLKGQGQVLRSYPAQILRLLTKGPAGWSLLSSIFLKPKTLLVPIKAAALFAALMAHTLWGGPIWIGLTLLGGVSLLMDLGVYLFSLRYVSDKKETMKALALAPLYLALWLKSLALSVVSGNSWLRARPRAPLSPMAEAPTRPIRFVTGMEVGALVAVREVERVIGQGP